MQGVAMNYEKIITPEAVVGHLRTIEKREAKEASEREAEMRLAEEEALAVAAQLSPAIKRSKSVWSNLQPLVNEAAMPHLDIIASHIKEIFICAGSYPAPILSSI